MSGEFSAILDSIFFTRVSVFRVLQKGAELKGGGVGKTQMTGLIIEGTRPQNSPSETADRLKCHKTNKSHV